ncbi:unnamed protein product, partial [Allacma fusca]
NVAAVTAQSDLMTKLEEMQTENKRYQKVVIAKLLSIETEIQDLKKVSILQQSVTNLEDLSLPDLPLQTKTDVIEIERWLELPENRNKLVITMGGKSAEQAIRNILEKLISSCLARHINYTGKNQKLNFQTLKIGEVIIDSVRLHPDFATLTDQKAKEVYINYFRNSKALKGGN